MSEREKQDLTSSAVPFFARYLEGQFSEDLSVEEMEKVTGGSEVVTQRYPSDQEDAVTLAFPSDEEVANPGDTGSQDFSFPKLDLSSLFGKFGNFGKK